MSVTLIDILWSKIKGMGIVDISDRLTPEKEITIRKNKILDPSKFIFEEKQLEMNIEREDLSFSKQCKELKDKLMLEAHQVRRYERYVRDKATGIRMRVKKKPKVVWRDKKFLLSYFRDVNFADHDITHLDKGLSNLVNLTELDVSSNQIQSLENLPAQIEVINAYNNHIQVFSLKPTANLFHLGLGYNDITCIDGLLPACNALLSLDLSYNNISDLGEFIASLRLFKNLRHLSLEGNPICLLPDYISTIRAAAPLLTLFDGVPVTAELPNSAPAKEETAKKSDEEQKEGKARLTVWLGNLSQLSQPELPEEQVDGDTKVETSAEFYLMWRLADQKIYKTNPFVWGEEDIVLSHLSDNAFDPDTTWYRFIKFLGLDFVLYRLDTITTTKPDPSAAEGETKDPIVTKEVKRHVVGVAHLRTDRFVVPRIKTTPGNIVIETKIQFVAPQASETNIERWNPTGEWRTPLSHWSDSQVGDWVKHTKLIGNKEVRDRITKVLQTKNISGKRLIELAIDEDYGKIGYRGQPVQKVLDKDSKYGVLATEDQRVLNKAVWTMLETPTVIPESEKLPEKKEESSTQPSINVIVCLNPSDNKMIRPPIEEEKNEEQ